uniref:Uncharacterized protein n=1 Tax=Anguilla anguilla TaxID=7936 RepID=A0A0E9XZ30_ANGAN
MSVTFKINILIWLRQHSKHSHYYFITDIYLCITVKLFFLY